MTKLFNTYKTDVPNNKSYLDHHAIEKIFHPCPPHDGMPFDPNTDVRCEETGPGASYFLTFDVWLALWQKAFCENAWRAFKFLYYTGFVGQLKDVVHPVQWNIKDIFDNKGTTESRHIFTCFVIGAAQSGKSAFLDTIVQGRANGVDRISAQDRRMNSEQNAEVGNEDRGSRFAQAHGVTANELDQVHPGDIRSIIDKINGPELSSNQR